jgi:hypothetical protein
MKKLLSTAVLLSLCNSANAVSLLSSVTEDRYGMFTYSYIVDNRDGTTPINDVAILVGPGFEPVPALNVIAPTGWSEFQSVSGGIANPPYSEIGAFYEFYTPIDNAMALSGNYPDAILPGTISGAFSFASWTQPGIITSATGSINNYFMFSALDHSFPGDGIVGFGTILAPDLPNATPLPAALPLFASGLGGMALMWWRKRKTKK